MNLLGRVSRAAGVLTLLEELCAAYALAILNTKAGEQREPHLLADGREGLPLVRACSHLADQNRTWCPLYLLRQLVRLPNMPPCPHIERAARCSSFDHNERYPRGKYIGSRRHLLFRKPSQ